jgi:hypothetical protein
MTQDQDEGAGAGPEALASLARNLKNPSFRRAFAADAEGALGQQGIDRAGINSDVLQVLAGLSPEELATLARVREVLEAQGVPPHIRAEMV